MAPGCRRRGVLSDATVGVAWWGGTEALVKCGVFMQRLGCGLQVQDYQGQIPGSRIDPLELGDAIGYCLEGVNRLAPWLAYEDLSIEKDERFMAKGEQSWGTKREVDLI